MKLPSHVLTKLCLAGAVGAVVAAVGCEKARVESATEERADPVVIESVAMPTFAEPPPGAAPRLETPQPKPVIPPQLVPKKQRPKPQPAFKVHACGPCGMG